ncbi:MAG: hypothetical protein ACYT04_32785 [Nostoc sp.]
MNCLILLYERLRQRLLYETLLYETLRVACFHEVVRQAQGIALRERSVEVPNAPLPSCQIVKYFV